VDGQQPSEEARAAARRIIEMEFWNGRYKLLIFGTYIGVTYPSNKGGHDGADHYRVPLARAFDEFAANAVDAERSLIIAQLEAAKEVWEQYGTASAGIHVNALQEAIHIIRFSTE
jgi:hypothetical protein